MIALFLLLLLQTVQQPAKLQPYQGANIFYMSTPEREYTTLATFKVKQSFTGEPKEQIKTALEKLRKEYPQADGLIFTDVNMQQAEAIKFK